MSVLGPRQSNHSTRVVHVFLLLRRILFNIVIICVAGNEHGRTDRASWQAYKVLDRHRGVVQGVQLVLDVCMDTACVCRPPLALCWGHHEHITNEWGLIPN